MASDSRTGRSTPGKPAAHRARICDSAWLHQSLTREGVLERRGEYLVQPLATSGGRADADSRRTFLVWEGRTVLFHVTVGRSLRAAHRRHAGFAEQFPELACHPLFLLQRDAMDIAGREFFPGRNLEDAVRATAVDAATAAAIVDHALGQLASAERASTPAAALKELAAFGDELLAIEAWSDIDRLFLRDIVLPFLRDHLGAGPFRRRWSNGDFIAKNLILGPENDVRLIDYEFATRTHFFADDCLRFQAHSQIPESVKRAARALQRPPSAFEAIYTLLNHARLSARVLADEPARSELAAVAGRVAELVAVGSSRRSFFLLPSARAAYADAAASTSPEAKVYWSDSGAFTEASSTAVSYAPGRIVNLAVDLPAAAPVRHLRIDPAERAGLLHLSSLRVRSLATLESLWEARDATAMAAIQVGGTALRLPSAAGLTLLSTGDDPWIVLPLLDRILVEPLRIEIQLRLDDSRAALERAAAEIDALNSRLSEPGTPRSSPPQPRRRRTRRAGTASG